MSSRQNFAGQNENTTIETAFSYIPKNSLPEARRLLKVVEESGQEDFAALKALYRGLHGQPHYAEIHQGLREYFEADSRA